MIQAVEYNVLVETISDVVISHSVETDVVVEQKVSVEVTSVRVVVVVS